MFLQNVVSSFINIDSGEDYISNYHTDTYHLLDQGDSEVYSDFCVTISHVTLLCR